MKVTNEIFQVGGSGLTAMGDAPMTVPHTIYLDGKNINFEMVKAGLAEVCRGKFPIMFDPLIYGAAEKAARGIAKTVIPNTFFWI